MDTKRLRQRVLDLAIHGKLVPQNPQDEPASELLKRIAAEKERLIKEGKIKKSKKKDNEDIEKVPFEVPQGWVWCRLKNLCSKFSTGPFGSMVHKNDYVQINGTPLINPANIIEGKIESDKIMMVSEEKSNELAKYELNVNDIILARRGDLSKCAIISDIEKNWLCGTGAFFLHLIYIYPHYFKTFYLSVYLQNILSSKSVGATMDNLNQSILGDVLFPLPPLAEQHRIVSEVEKYFSLIDILEESENDLQQSIQKARSKILDLAIKGKLVEKTGEWEYTNLGSVFQHNTGKALNRSAEQSGKLLPYITTSNLYWGRFELDTVKSMYFKENEIEKCTVTKGDLLVCEGGDIGRSAIWDYDYDICIQNHIHRLRPIKDALPKFYYYVMMHYKRTDNIEGKGIGMLGLSSKQLDKLIIPFPPLAEQQRIVAKIEELFNQLDNIAEALK